MVTRICMVVRNQMPDPRLGKDNQWVKLNDRLDILLRLIHRVGLPQGYCSSYLFEVRHSLRNKPLIFSLACFLIVDLLKG